jgi:bifunctional non-homologous end joining protein LigD
VIVWDEGEYAPLDGDLAAGHLAFTLHGRKLRGGFALTRTGPRSWILVKMVDDRARRGSDVVAEQPGSVRSGRTIGELAAGAGRRAPAQ